MPESDSHGVPPPVRCAIYTRKSSEEGLEKEFNSLAAQREAAEAYIYSQRQEGWVALPETYDDGGFTGANMERPALHKLLGEIAAGRVGGGVQSRSPEPLAAGLRTPHGGVREARQHIRVGHTAVQHQHPGGPPDAPHPALVCLVRARDHQRADPRQEGGGQAQREMDRRVSALGLRFGGSRRAADCQHRGSAAGLGDLRAFCQARS
jgi:hypothetical protein